MEGVWILAAVIAFVAIMAILAYFISRRTAVQLAALAREFGSDITAKGGFTGDTVISFERCGTIFTGRITRMKYACHYRVHFETEPSDLQFQIKTQRPKGFASYARQPSADSVSWRLSLASPLAVDYLLSSNDSQKFDSLIADHLIAAEIKKYDLLANQYIEILFEAGSFELFYGTDGLDSEQKLRDIFQTAINFHDRLSPKSVE